MNIKTGSYLPFTMIALGVLLILSSVFVIEVQPILAAIFIFIGIILSTTHRRLKVDLKSSYYQEFVWILGYKYGEKKKISGIEFIYITSSNASQQVGFAARTTLHTTQYTAYLKFDRYNKALIAQSISRYKLMSKVEKISQQLRVVIEDYS